MPTVCFLDLDGVLADFVTAALAIHGKSLSRKDTTWGFPSQIGFAGVNDPAFWKPLDYGFWLGLGWMPDGERILAAVEEVFGRENVCVLTSPCDTPGGVEGKAEWVRRNLPEYRRRFFVGPSKWMMAGPGKVLVDDHDGNVDAFARAGGRTVLVSRPWNSRTYLTDAEGLCDVARLRSELKEAM